MAFELQTEIEARLGQAEPDVEVLLAEVVSGTTLRLFIDHPDGVTLACYSEVQGRLFVFAATPRSLRVISLSEPAARLSDLTELFRTAIAKDDEPRVAALGTQLHRLLISPLAEELTTARTLASASNSQP